MQTQPGNLGEISVKLARSRGDLYCRRDLAEMTEISSRFFSNFMPRIFLCGCPYDITASWLKAFNIVKAV